MDAAAQVFVKARGGIFEETPEDSVYEECSMYLILRMSCLCGYALISQRPCFPLKTDRNLGVNYVELGNEKIEDKGAWVC